MNKKQEVNPVLNEKDQAPSDLPPEGETQNTEGNTSEKLPELPSIAPLCRHEIE